MFVPTDRESGRPRGFAFVTYEAEAEANEAIKRFDGQELDGRSLRVNMAEDRPRRSGGFPSPGGFRGGNGGGGGGGGGDFSDPFFGGGGKPKSKGSRRHLRARKRGGY